MAYVNDSPTERTPKPILFDTDMGTDDWMALLLLLRHPAVDLRAVTVTGNGVANLTPGVCQALRLIKLAGKEGQTPVAAGQRRPGTRRHAFPKSWRLKEREMQEVCLPSSNQLPFKQDAADAIIFNSRSTDRKITLVAAGPLTNIATALHRDSSLAGRVEMIYCMGGAVDVCGNAPKMSKHTNRLVAEWNIYLDAQAASIVFSSGIPLTLVPLDATNDVPLTKDLKSRLHASKKTPWAEFVSRVICNLYAKKRADGYCFWDPLTTAICLDEHRFTTIREMSLEIVEEAGPTFGQTRRAQQEGCPIRVCQGANKQEFEKFFLEFINR